MKPVPLSGETSRGADKGRTPYPIAGVIGRLAVVAGLCLVQAASAQPIPPPSERVAFPPPMSPSESLAAIRVSPEMRVELVAAEPEVMDPIDVSWGPDGRMWVVEMADYPLGMDTAGTPGGRIRVLTSTRGDGKYDRSTIFAENLRFPTSAVVWRDGVIVAAAPDILFLQDTDGDGRADKTTRLFTGLGEGNQQHMANGLRWGMDGWLYLANGGTRGKIVSARSGVSIEMGGDVRIRPDEGIAEPQSGRSQFGRNRDDWGSWFGNNNANPLWHYALEDHYLRRNPYLAPPNSTLTVPEIPGAARVYPVSHTLARFNSPGGFNHFTSACSPVIYRDDLLGAEYYGNVFVCEPVHNLVHREIVRPKGVTFSSRRAPAEQTSEFLASADNWSRFTSARAGPDGALYVVDMYRKVIEHPQYIPGAWLKQLGDLRVGSDKGRIYRVYPRDAALRPPVRLDRADTAGLVGALASHCGVVRDLAQEQLFWRDAESATPGLEQLLVQSDRPQTRVQALCTLDLLGTLTPAHVARGLADPHAGVRRQAVRLSERFAASHAELLAGIIRLVDDPDAMVRQQVAYSLGEWRQPQAGVALARLVRESDDRFIIAAAMSSAVPHAGTMIAHLDITAGIDRTLLEIAAATLDPGALLNLVRNIAAPRSPAFPAMQFNQLAQVLDALARHRRPVAVLDPPAGTGGGEPLPGVVLLVDAARKIASSSKAPVTQRVAALSLLGRQRAEQMSDLRILSGVVTPQSPVEVKLAAIAAMKHLTLPSVPGVLLAGWAGYEPQVREAILDLLTGRSEWAAALLDRVAADHAMLPQIDTAHRAALTGHADPAVAARADEVLKAGIDADRQKVIDRYLAATSGLVGDAGRGAAVFKNTCSVCHQLGAVEGRAIGPDLASINDRSAPYIITHVLDPNRVVESRYVLYAGSTNDGRTLAGMLANEAGNSITLVGLDGSEQVILRSDLKTLEGTGRSLMPEGLEAVIDPQGMADLVAYLAGMHSNDRRAGKRKKR